MSNVYRVEDGVAILSLSRGQETKIDLADLEAALVYRWYATPNVMNGFYVSARPNQVTVYLHRFLLDAPKGLTVDHINHDTLDNRRENLRIITNQENNENRNGAYSTSKTGIRGVTVHKCKPSGLMYSANVQVKGKHHARYFPYTPEGLIQATIAVQEMREKLMTHS